MLSVFPFTLYVLPETKTQHTFMSKFKTPHVEQPTEVNHRRDDVSWFFSSDITKWTTSVFLRNNKLRFREKNGDGQASKAKKLGFRRKNDAIRHNETVLWV